MKTISWKQIALNHIEVTYPINYSGYKELEVYLNIRKLTAVKRKYDKVNNKVTTTYKRR